MSDGQVQIDRGGRDDAERRWRILAVAVVIGGLILLAAFGGLGYGLSQAGGAAASAGHSLVAVVRAPDRNGPPPLEAGWRHTPANAVIFYGGYFCAHRPAGRSVRLVLALRELDTLTQGSSSVVGPFLTKAQTRGAC